jgi:hypothetical protein
MLPILKELCTLIEVAASFIKASSLLVPYVRVELEVA